MRALWVEEGRVVLREDLPTPRPGPGEALLGLRLAGICATDLELLRGYQDFRGVPGHELVADVLEAPSAPGWVGARVIGEINAACGCCPTCRAGRPRHCPQRTVLGLKGRGGAFAERFTLPLENLHRVPAAMSDEAAVFTEPLAAALEVGEQIQLRPEQRVLLIGAGRLGQLLARTLVLGGCALQVVARHPRQRTLLEAVHIPCVTDAEVAPGDYDLVVEASGSPSGWELALRAVRPGATLVLKSTYRDRIELDLSLLVVNEVSVVGSRCGPFAPALRLLEAGLVDPIPLVDGCLPLEQAPAAFAAAARPGALKWLIAP